MPSPAQTWGANVGLALTISTSSIDLSREKNGSNLNLMHVVVTGGAGFIGSNFVHRTLETRPQARVTVLDSFSYAANPASLAGLPEDRVRVVRGSVADLELVRRVLGDAEDPVDVVVHFAAESHNDNSLRDPLSFVRSNVEGTVVLAMVAAELGIRLHHISTDEVFGDLELDDPAKFRPDTNYAPSSPYSASKAASDHFVRAFVRSHGLRATISNCSNNYGPRQHPEKFIPRQIIGLIEGRLPRVYGTSENVRDWIHVDDHNDAVWRIIERGEIGETYLIGADGERTNTEVVREILRAFGRGPEEFVRVTDRPGHDRRYAIDASSTLALGWRPQHQDFREGLAETIQWYRDNPSWWRDSAALAEARYREVEEELPQEGH